MRGRQRSARAAFTACDERLRTLLQDVLNLRDGWLTHGRDTPLLGALPQLDSMAAVAVLTELEARFDLRIDDRDISAEMFSSFGHLLDFVEARVGDGALRAGPCGG